MINIECFMAYRRRYPETEIEYDEGLGELCVYVKDGYRIAPESETEETFLDRPERSEKAGRNLFLEEWIFRPDPLFWGGSVRHTAFVKEEKRHT